MMFLQYAVWGVWLPVLARYLQAPTAEGGLGFRPGEVGWILGLAGSIGAITAPFVAGQLADRHLATEKLLAALLVAGGVIKIWTAYQTELLPWILLSIAYSVLFMPTLALTNSLAMAHLDDPQRQFPHVRVWGTIGWIAASWLFPLFWLLEDVRPQALPPFYGGVEVADATSRLGQSLIVSGVVAIAYAAFCLFLPHTPPQPDAPAKLAFAKAFALLRKRSFAVLMACSLLISVIHQIYFMQTAPFFSDVLGLRDSQIGPAMSIGQFAEIAAMAMVGALLARLRFRAVLTLGALAYVGRFAIFAAAGSLPVGLVVSSQVLHGLCYACFFAVAFIYVDRLADDDVRHSAQTVFGIVILGLGPVLAAPFLDVASRYLTTGDALSYSGLWGAAAFLGLLAAAALALFFRDETAERATAKSA